MWGAGEGGKGPSRNTERNREESAAQGRTYQGLMETEQSLLVPKFIELDNTKL